MFELIERDAGGRIGKFTIGSHKITTPNICVVINPRKMIISPEELKREFGAEIIITNSFIIKSKEDEVKQKIIEQGLHKFLGWNGPIYTDSGSFQFFSQNKQENELNPLDIISFQKSISSDIITPVDLFTFPDDSKKDALRKLKETTERVKKARQSVDFLVGPIQGGSFLELRKKACKEISKINPDLFAIGGIVPYMEQYKYKDLFDIILTCKQNLPSNIPVHYFGLGHPISIALAVAFGGDVFDSAIYALASRQNRYLTVQGTYHLEELSEFPCSCPICVKHSPAELMKMEAAERQILLAKHNLYATFSELRTVRQAIKDNSLWELAQMRCRSHPALLEAFRFCLIKYKKYFQETDLLSKKSAFFYGGEETEFRPEAVRAKEKLKLFRASKTFFKQPFGKIPVNLKNTYPFSQSIIPGFRYRKIKIDHKKEALDIIKYQYGKIDERKFKKTEVEVSKKTGRLRRLFLEKKLLGTFRPSDNFFVPVLEGSKLIQMKKVFVKEREIAELIKSGKDLFAKFISKTSEFVYPGEEVAVCYKNNILGVGKAFLNSKEMKEFKRGIAVKIR